jgi:hypothetical protein
MNTKIPPSWILWVRSKEQEKSFMRNEKSCRWDMGEAQSDRF